MFCTIFMFINNNPLSIGQMFGEQTNIVHRLLMCSPSDQNFF